MDKNSVYSLVCSIFLWFEMLISYLLKLIPNKIYLWKRKLFYKYSSQNIFRINFYDALAKCCHHFYDYSAKAWNFLFKVFWLFSIFLSSFILVLYHIKQIDGELNILDWNLTLWYGRWKHFFFMSLNYFIIHVDFTSVWLKHPFLSTSSYENLTTHYENHILMKVYNSMMMVKLCIIVYHTHQPTIALIFFCKVS